MTVPRHVVVMARRPERGRVKTRLAEAIGDGPALAFYRRTLGRTLQCLSTGPWTTVIAATPAAAARHGGSWTRGLPVIPQSSGDLGARMQSAIDAMPRGPVVVVGSDIPDLRRRHVIAAFRVLRYRDAVFGPSCDGGYWLVGVAPTLRGRPIFGSVRWSTEHALSDTLNGLPAGSGTGLLERLVDVDTFEDLKQWRRSRSANLSDGPVNRPQGA